VSRVPFELAVLGETPPMITADNAPIVRLLAGELGQTGTGSGVVRHRRRLAQPARTRLRHLGARLDRGRTQTE
jgi:hypothetical protein